MKIVKRDGRIVDYNKDKIIRAITKANRDVSESEQVNSKQIDKIIKNIEDLNKKRMLVEDIQDMIETELMKIKKYELAKAYIIYRYKRALIRKSNNTDESIINIIKYNNDNTNDLELKNNLINQRSLISFQVSKDIAKRMLLPEIVTNAINKNLIYFNNLEYFLEPMIESSIMNYNNLGNNLETSISNYIGLLNQIKYSQIYFTIDLRIFDNILEKDINDIKNNINNYKLIKKDKEELINKLIENKINNGVNNLLLGLNSIKFEKPFNLLINLNNNNELFIKTLLNNINNYNINNLIINYVINMDSLIKYKDTTISLLNNNNYKIRLISEKIMLDTYNEFIIPLNNLFLNKSKINIGTVTINMPNISLECNNEDEFNNILDDRLNLSYEALIQRYYSLIGTNSNITIEWENGLLSSLNNEKIDKELKRLGNLNLSICGLYESFIILNNKNIYHDYNLYTNKIIKKIKNTLNNFKKDFGISFTLSVSNEINITNYFYNHDLDYYNVDKYVDSYSNGYTNKNYDVNDLINVNKYNNMLNGILNYCKIDNNKIIEDLTVIYENSLYTEIIN